MGPARGHCGPRYRHAPGRRRGYPLERSSVAWRKKVEPYRGLALWLVYLLSQQHRTDWGEIARQGVLGGHNRVLVARLNRLKWRAVLADTLGFVTHCLELRDERLEFPHDRAAVITGGGLRQGGQGLIQVVRHESAG